jgi:acetyl-CoA C-acetyltransferase
MLRNRLDSTDIDYWEINEAFAAQVQACLLAWQDDDYCRTEMGLEHGFTAIDEERLNVDGGGVSIGHPVGASGARIVLHLAKTLQRTGARRGMASLCIGGGQGGAMLIERVA